VEVLPGRQWPSGNLWGNPRRKAVTRVSGRIELRSIDRKRRSVFETVEQRTDSIKPGLGDDSSSTRELRRFICGQQKSHAAA